MSQPQPVLYYVHDPMCSWCWGFRPVLLELKRLLPAEIQLQSLVGGLAKDSNEPMPATLQQHLQGAWKHIQQVIPGTRFNFDFWTDNTPRRSTYPACRAVIAARQLDPECEDEMTYAIQQAYYLNARNPSDLATLIDVATTVGLDPAAFEQLMRSDTIHTLLTQELAGVHAIHVNSFPSLVLKLDSALYPIAIDYLSAPNLIAEVHRIRNLPS